jgi:hypothetical protein
MIDPAAMVPSFQDAPLEVYDELSRYRGLPLVKLTYPDGREVVYVARRFLRSGACAKETGSTSCRRSSSAMRAGGGALPTPTRRSIPPT